MNEFMKKIGDAVKNIHKEDLQKQVAKEGRIELRVTDEEKEEIRDIAGSLGLSVGEYLLNLHRYARKRLLAEE